MREDLFKQLKQEPDRNRRREILAQAKSTEEYQAAKTETIASRIQKLERKRILEQQGEKLRSGETKESILDGVQAFTGEVLDLYPQVNEEGKLNYYFSGSLGVMLLLLGGKFEILDESRIPEIVPIAEKQLPPEAIKYFGNFVRKIGDLDFVPLDEWEKSKKRMRKGGGGPKMDQLSEKAKKVLKDTEGLTAIMCDPLAGLSQNRVVRVKLEGKDIYTTEPKMMLAYKIVHLGQSFDNGRKTEKFVSDFDAMIKGMEAMYSRKELVQVAHDTLFEYSPERPNDAFVPYYNKQFSGELKRFWDEILALDTDAPYLNQLQYGRERSVGVLKILHKLQSPEAKQTMIDFFNQQKKQIDDWSPNQSSPRNRDIIADFILSRPELLDDFKKHIQGDISKNSIVEALKTHVWAIGTYGKLLPDNSGLDMQPNSSSIMDILVRIDEKNINQELQDVGELLEFGMQSYILKTILEAKFTADLKIRSNLFDALKSARATISDSDFQQLSRLLSSAVSNSSIYDMRTGGYVNFEEAERGQKVADVFEQYGIEYKKV